MSGIALKGRRAPFYSRMVSGYSGAKLDWIIESGLTWRGTMPPDWSPSPSSLKAWLFLIFVMIPRGVFK